MPQEKMATSVGQGESVRPPFSLLNLDVLKTLCDAVELSSTEQPTIKALDGLSRTNRLLRNVCLPSIFRVVHIRGDWDQAMTKVGEMLEYSALGTYVRSDDHVTPLQCRLFKTDYAATEPLNSYSTYQTMHNSLHQKDSRQHSLASSPDSKE